MTVDGLELPNSGTDGATEESATQDRPAEGGGEAEGQRRFEGDFRECENFDEKKTPFKLEKTISVEDQCVLLGAYNRQAQVCEQLGPCYIAEGRSKGRIGVLTEAKEVFPLKSLDPDTCSFYKNLFEEIGDIMGMQVGVAGKEIGTSRETLSVNFWTSTKPGGFDPTPPEEEKKEEMWAALQGWVPIGLKLLGLGVVTIMLPGEEDNPKLWKKWQCKFGLASKGIEWGKLMRKNSMVLKKNGNPGDLAVRGMRDDVREITLALLQRHAGKLMDKETALEGARKNIETRLGLGEEFWEVEISPEMVREGFYLTYEQKVEQVLKPRMDQLLRCFQTEELFPNPESKPKTFEDLKEEQKCRGKMRQQLVTLVKCLVATRRMAMRYKLFLEAALTQKGAVQVPVPALPEVEEHLDMEDSQKMEKYMDVAVYISQDLRVKISIWHKAVGKYRTAIEEMLGKSKITLTELEGGKTKRSEEDEAGEGALQAEFWIRGALKWNLEDTMWRERVSRFHLAKREWMEWILEALVHTSKQWEYGSMRLLADRLYAPKEVEEAKKTTKEVFAKDKKTRLCTERKYLMDRISLCQHEEMMDKLAKKLVEIKRSTGNRAAKLQDLTAAQNCTSEEQLALIKETEAVMDQEDRKMSRLMAMDVVRMVGPWEDLDQ